MQAAADYYDAQAAQASLNSNLEIEELAKKSADAAQMRVEKGVAPISDELQARTAYALAVVNRVKAAAELKLKGGALAGDMGMDPDRMITVPQAESGLLGIAARTHQRGETQPPERDRGGEDPGGRAGRRKSGAGARPSHPCLGRWGQPLQRVVGSELGQPIGAGQRQQ